MMRYAKAFKCHKCPERGDDQGCPAWWEYPAQNGRIVKGCSFSQEVMLPLIGGMMHETACAAASADKAANFAADARSASMGSMSLVLGLSSGEIKPPSAIVSAQPLQLEARDDEEIRAGSGQVR